MEDATQTNILNDKVVLISLGVHCFSGYRRATREHIAQLGGKLPASAAITEGSIRVFPNKALTELQSVRRALFRKIAAMGIQSLDSANVFAIPVTDLAAAETAVRKAEIEFADKLADLDAKYETLFEQHVADNKEAEAIIRQLKIPKDAAIASCRLSTSVFKIAPMEREGVTEEEGLEAMVSGLGRQLYEEVAAEMEQLLKHDAFGKQRVGQRSLRPLKLASEKLAKWEFLDRAAAGGVKLINETLKRIPGQGYIEGQHFMTLETLVTGMSDPDWLVNAASRVANGCEVLDVLFPEQLQSEEDEQVEQEAEQTEAVVATPAPVSTLPALPGFFPSAPAQAPVQPVPAVVATALPQAPAGVPLKRHVGQNRLVF